MPFLRKGEILPSKGQNRSIPSEFLASGYHFPRNMIYKKGELTKIDGKRRLSTRSIGGHAVNHHAVFELSNLSQFLIRHTKRNVEYYDSINDVWVDCTGLDLTGTDIDFFSSTIVNEEDLYLFTNYVDFIRQLDSAFAPSSVLTNLFKAKLLEYITPYVLAAHLEESGDRLPYKLRWCDTADPTVWVGGNSGSVLLSDEPSAIRAMKRLADLAFVYKEKSVYRGNKVNTSSIFNFIPFQTNKGIYSPRALAEANDSHYYMGLNDFHYNNGIRISEIGEPIREYIFNRLNRTRNETCFALSVNELKEIWFFITITGQDWPTEVWRYKWDMDFWYMDDCLSLTTAITYKNTRALRWDDMIPTWDDGIGDWDSISGQADAPLITYGRNDGFSLIQDPSTVNDDGAAVVEQFETADWTGARVSGDISIDVRWTQGILYAGGTSVKIYYSTDEGANWNFIGTTTLQEEVKPTFFYFDIWAPKIRFKFVADDLNEFFKMRAFQPYYIDRQEVFGAVTP